MRVLEKERRSSSPTPSPALLPSLPSVARSFCPALHIPAESGTAPFRQAMPDLPKTPRSRPNAFRLSRYPLLTASTRFFASRASISFSFSARFSLADAVRVSPSSSICASGSMRCFSRKLDVVRPVAVVLRHGFRLHLQYASRHFVDKIPVVADSSTVPS